MRIRVSLQHRLHDGLGVSEDRTPLHPYWDVIGGVQNLRHVLGLRGHLLQDVLAVEPLTTHQEPDSRRREVRDDLGVVHDVLLGLPTAASATGAAYEPSCYR